MRKKPYTNRGITRCKCIRCGASASDSWSACAVGNKWMPVCTACDVRLNEIALRFMLGRERAAPYLVAYRRAALPR